MAMITFKFEWARDGWTVAISDGENRVLIPLDEWPALVDAILTETPTRTSREPLFRRSQEAATRPE
jgi:hypothetical protein